MFAGKKRIKKMFVYEEEHTAEDYTASSNSDACAKIIVDLAFDAKRALDTKCFTMLRMKIEDMLLKTLGMVDYKEMEGRCEEMIEVICEALDIGVIAVDKYSKDYFCGKISELVNELVSERFESVEPMLNELMSHESAVKDRFNRFGVKIYDTFGKQV